MTTLRILIENTAPDGLIAEHGLSFLVTTATTEFVFDCGHTGAAFDNAKRLGVDPAAIKLAAISHAHYDHAGGFPKLLDFAQIETLVTGTGFWDEKFSRDGDGFKYRGSGFDEKFLSAHNVTQKICRDVLQIDADACFVGNFARRFDFETIPTKFVKGDGKVPDGNVTLHPIGLTLQHFQLVTNIENCFTPDDFSDEIALILRDGDGLAVVTACAHVGVCNIVADVADRFSRPVRTVIGGLHLTGATDERIVRTLTELKTFGVEKILPCHCSGENFTRLFVDRPKTGSVITIA